MHEEICNKILNATCSLNIFLGEEKISSGTGFSFFPNGQAITAGHVVTGRFPLKDSDVKDPNVKIFGKYRSLPTIEYKVQLCGITILTDFTTEPIQVDLAILAPKDDLVEPIPYLPTKLAPPKLGETVFLAGFSDEIELPFLFETKIKKSTAGMNKFFEAMEVGYKADMLSLMIKKGMVGNIKGYVFEDSSSGKKIEGEIFYVDNGMHSGASGGPIVNVKGEVIGFISERAITKVPFEDTPKLKVPSGSTLGLSLKPLLALNSQP